MYTSVAMKMRLKISSKGRNLEVHEGVKAQKIFRKY